ncbi:hypothetical protein [Pseudomonas sp. O230]|uniref:hypothetical protein n=1 Tax=Pseudomonas sp. O230 TaxID=3159450 RepID=UPI00387B0880
MKEGMQLSDLQELFLNFETIKLEGCRVVYLNKTLADGKSSEAILEAYSYAVSSDSTPPLGQSSVKTFMAERYGGDGILSNGGGGRCGFDGVWQLKGLGPNQLVGKDVDADHGDGNLSLDTAIYESIWSEIINAALPFGAIRTVAVLDSGRSFEERGISTPRGLLVRQPVVRPAHFIRAIYFKEQQFDRLSEDALRVKAVIVKLIDFLPGTGVATTTSNMSDRLRLGLFELAARFAEQFAAAKAKHIIHYNVSASNLSLDGAWLDLSGTRLFTKLIGIDQVDIDRFNLEHFPAVQSLQSLCYYLGKYSVISAEDSVHILDKTTKHFAKIYNEQLSLYQVAQAGFPLWILRLTMGSPELSKFSRNLGKVLALNDFTVNQITSEGGWNGYERWTARLFSELLLSRVNASATNLSWLKADATVINKLLSSYRQLFILASKIANEQNVNLQNFNRCVLINLTRLNRSHSVLHDLKIEIERIRINTSGDEMVAYKALSDEATLAATLNLGNEQGRSVPFWLSRTLSIWFDPASGMFTLQEADSRSLSIESLLELSEQRPNITIALSFYRNDWNNINETKI